MVYVNSIELDDDQSDAESTDSATDVFADIPLPSATVAASTKVIPLPHTSSAISSLPTLDAIPLPKAPVSEKPITEDQRALSLSDGVGSAAKVDAVSKTDESTSSVRSGDAVHAKTSIGTITVLLNRKLGPRVSKASIFDVPDDNAKEVNRKLLKLRRLKRMKKSKDGQSELEVGSVTGRKALQQRISEWKEELLNDQNFKLKHGAKGPFLTATVGDMKDKELDTAQEDHKTEAKNQTAALMASGIKSEAGDSKPLPSQKSDDSYMIKLYNSFMKVASSNDLAQLDWPREMIRETTLAPKLVYSCNPLYFNFRKLCTQQNGESKEEPKKHRHQKKHKKNRVGKVEDHSAGSAAGEKDLNNLDVGKDKMESHKTLKKDRRDATKERTKISKNLLDHELQNKKKKSIERTGKPTESNTSRQSNKVNLPAADDQFRKHVSRRHSQSAQLTVADDDVARLTGALKDTGKSRWDTSSDSELETAPVSASDLKTSEIMRSKVPLDHQSHALNQQHSPDDRSRSPSSHWSSDSSVRSCKRSRYRSRSSSASSCSRSGSSYRSSSYSYRRRRRLTYDSLRSSCSYSDTGSDYSHSSWSYSRSRSVSRRRRWRSRSYSRSARSRSSSVSCSPPRRHSGSQLRPCKNRSNWRSQIISKRPRVEQTAAPQTKPPTHPPKPTNIKSTTDAGSETKNSSDVIKPAVALTEPAGGGSSCTEVKDTNLTDLKLANSEKSTEVVADSAAQDVKSIPTPEEHMQSIPLPVPEDPLGNKSFIGPVLPSNHPLAHKQDIPLPATAKFQCIGPNDPLVFRSMPPPPPPPASLTSHNQAGPSVVPPPRPPSPPADEIDDIAGDEDPIPQMLDVRTLKPATFIPPEQDEQYGALRRQAELHARRQQIREETGMDIADDDEDDNVEAVQEEQLADQAYIDEAAAMFSTTPVLHMPQHHLLGQPLSTSVTMMPSGPGLVPVQMVPAAGGGGLVGLEPSLVSLVQQGQTPTVLAVSPAAAALARAQEEAEAEAQIRQQVAVAQAIAAAQRRRTTELVQLLPGQVGVGAASSPALATLRPAGLSLQAVPLHTLTSQQPQQQLIQLPAGRIISVPNVIPGGMQVIAQPQAQPAPLVIGPNGTVLRLIR